MAAIKSVKTSSGARVQVGSKAYNKRVGGGESLVSNTGKNLSSSDIKKLGGTTAGYTDQPSTQRAHIAARDAGELLPYEQDQAVDTSQPNPATAQVQTPVAQAQPEIGYEQAQQNLAQGGLTGGALKTAQSTLANRYQQGFQAAQSAGVQAPTDGGQARSIVGQYTPANIENQAIDQVFSDDPVINQIMQGVTQQLSPIETKTSLLTDYKRLYRESGLKDINEELIDAETIIDGTEDDIRNEIQTAGGFGTESQVQAMTLARNKGLLKRYNQLFAAKQSAEQQLQTMMNLTVEDRKMAQERATNNINTMFKLADFRNQAQNAVRETNRFMLSQYGADGVYDMYKNDPVQLARYEKITGLPSGGLATAAVQARQQKASEQYLKSLQIKKAEQDVGIGLPATPAGQIPSDLLAKASEGERKGLGFLNRARDASEILSRFEDSGFNFGASKAINEGIGDFKIPFTNIKPLEATKAQDYRQYKQAAETWIKSTLRLESGATIPPDEMSSYFETFFPQFGEDSTTIEQKAQARASAEEGLSAIAGRLAPYANQGFNPASFYGE